MALGSTTLSKNTSGYVNVAIGNQSLQENTTGYSNMAIGYAALNKNTTGIYNNSIGSNALSLNTTGSDNTAIGGGALENNLTGGSNVAIGRSAMFSNTTAFYNDVIGNQALYSANSEGNQAIGFRALYALTSGSYNIGIGFEAGRYTSTGGANQTSSRSIYIGTDSRASLNGNTNEIVIGYQARGNGSNTTTLGNSSTTATYIPAGKMYIGGTTAPTATLHLPAGTATANTAPLKLTSGTNLTTPEVGAVEFDGTNLYVTNSVPRRETVNQGIKGSFVYDFGSIAANSYADIVLTPLTGAVSGDVVSVGVPNGSITNDIVFFAWVSSNDSVTLRCVNNSSTTARDPASGTYKIFVTKF